MDTLCPCTWPFVAMPSFQLYCIVHLVTFAIVIAIILSTDPPPIPNKDSLHASLMIPTNERKAF